MNESNAFQNTYDKKQKEINNSSNDVVINANKSNIKSIREDQQAMVNAGLKHKRTKSDYFFKSRKQQSPAPDPYSIPIQNSSAIPIPKEKTIQGTHKSSFKLILKPHDKEIPNKPMAKIPIKQINKQIQENYKSNNPKASGISYTNNTTITNNTNIILIGGHTYKINASANSPPELIHIKTKSCVPEKVRSDSKNAKYKESIGINNPPKFHLVVNQNIKDFDEDDDKNSGRSGSKAAHKRSISDSHGGNSKKVIENTSKITKLLDSEPFKVELEELTHGHYKPTIAEKNKALISEKNKVVISEKNKPAIIEKNKAKIVNKVEYSRKRQSGKCTPVKNNKIDSSNSKKSSGVTTTVVPSYNSSVTSSITANKHIKTYEHTKENSLDNSSVPEYEKELGILLNKKSEIVFTKTKDPLEEIKKPCIEPQKMDPRREKEMLELSEYIKDYWLKHRKAPETITNFYKIGKMLGKGAFGKVNLGIHKLSGKFVAVKSIMKQLMKDESSKSKVMKEVAIWAQLSHPSVIRLYETFESDKHLLYVEELCVGGDLLTYVRKRRRLKENVAKVVLKQILDGLYYCHSRKILHRDVKLDNILLNSEGNIKVIYLISNF
jgi:hypothetical protein